MNNKLPISCFIIAQDEADRITNTIESVIDIVDEVVVIDSGSTDGTQDLARQLGCKVFFNKWKGYGPQKRFGEDCAKNEWLLNLDADEYLSDQIKSEILQTFDDNNNHPLLGVSSALLLSLSLSVLFSLPLLLFF